MIEVVLREGIFFVPLVAEQFGRSVKSRSVHHVIQQGIDFLSVLLVETHRVRIVDEFADDARLTAVMQYVREDVLFVVVITPAGDNVIAYALCKLAFRILLDGFDIGEGLVSLCCLLERVQIHALKHDAVLEVKSAVLIRQEVIRYNADSASVRYGNLYFISVKVDADDIEG